MQVDFWLGDVGSKCIRQHRSNRHNLFR